MTPLAGGFRLSRCGLATGGEEIRNIDAEFDFYFQHVGSWLFHITGEFAKSRYWEEYIQAAGSIADSLVTGLGAIAETRFQRPVGFRLRFLALATGHPGFDTRPLSTAGEIEYRPSSMGAQSGHVIWLPPTTEIGHYDAVNLILRERYGLCMEQAPPDWVEPYKLPNQLPIEDEIAQLDQEILNLTAQVSQEQQRLTDVSRFQRLLYEQGEDALEPVVRDALRELGAEVEDPAQPGREDGRLVAPTGQHGMLEITSRTGSLRLGDVRQLNQWVADAVAEEDWDGKGLMIANTYCGDPIGQRGDSFPDTCIRTAERLEQCLVTATQLFRALCSHQRGELDVEGFWNTVFDTSDVCPLPELETLEEQAAEAGERDD